MFRTIRLLVLPLLLEPSVGLVKADYERPSDSGGGGRTTEWFKGKRDALAFDPEQYYEILREGLDELDARSRDILKRRFLGEPKATLQELADEYGAPVYARVDAPANREQKARLAKLSAEQVTATELAGEPITAKLTTAPLSSSISVGSPRFDPSPISSAGPSVTAA